MKTNCGSSSRRIPEVRVSHVAACFTTRLLTYTNPVFMGWRGVVEMVPHPLPDNWVHYARGPNLLSPPAFSLHATQSPMQIHFSPGSADTCPHCHVSTVPVPRDRILNFCLFRSLKILKKQNKIEKNILS